MNKIQSIEDFSTLDSKQKKEIYETELKRISKFIRNSDWYKKRPFHIRLEIIKNPPWQLYKNAKNGTPVRIYGYAFDKIKIIKRDQPYIEYLVATMEDDEHNTLSFGTIYDIDRIIPVSWEEIDEKYLNELKKAKPYGGDMLFLKPEMFLKLSELEP